MHEFRPGSESDVRFRKKDSEVSAAHLVQWGRTLLPHRPLIVFPFSGGLDSSVVLAFAAHVVGRENVLPINITHGTASDLERRNASVVSQGLGVRMLTADLSEVNEILDTKVSGLVDQLDHPGAGTAQVTQDASVVNTFTRLFARRLSQAQIAGTLDLTEILTGYFPKTNFTGDFLPIGGLTRSELRKVANEFGLPDLPERHAIVEGCGDIVAYSNDMVSPQIQGAQTRILGEQQLDAEIETVLQGGGEAPSPLEPLLRTMRHKSIEALRGRPVYYPNYARAQNLERFLTS